MAKISGIAPDEPHQRSVTLAAETELVTFGVSPLLGVEKTEVEAPTIGGNPFGMNFWEQEALKTNSGAAINPEAAAMKLGLKSYEIGVEIGKEAQDEVGQSEAYGEAVDAAVSQQRQEARVMDFTSQEFCAATKALSASSISAQAAPASINGVGTSIEAPARKATTHDTSSSASGASGIPTAKFAKESVSTASDIDRILARLFSGGKRDRYACRDCGGSEADSPLDVGLKQKDPTQAKGDKGGYDYSFFAKNPSSA